MHTYEHTHTRTHTTLTKLDWLVNYLKMENHVLLFFLHAPESSMVLDTQKTKYLFIEVSLNTIPPDMLH